MLKLRSYNKLDLLKLMFLSREGDRREGVLLRQGKGWFHVAGAGHEALGVIGLLLRSDDYLFTYYRDRAMLLARGVSNQELALGYFGKRDSSSGGRQMPSHGSCRERNIWSAPTTTAANLLPACGVAWGMQLAATDAVAVATVGDASTRQGEFLEAVAFAVERQLPLVFVVEDNGYGISTRTERMNPLRLGVLSEQTGIVTLDGRHPDQVAEAAANALDKARRGDGPTILHCEVDRLCNHTSSDDQRAYRSAEELAAQAARDPILVFAQDLIESGELTRHEWEELQQETRDQVDREYAAAERAEDPRVGEVEEHRLGPAPIAAAPPLEGGQAWRMVDALNAVFRRTLETDRRVVFFGQDIEDPKGGVFGLTKGLSTAFPDRVANSPLAEATIAGVACGLASSGFRPVFEIQFIDFVGPGWNQISQNLATLRWRSVGTWNCPCIIYAPYGAYLAGGGMWHSQANEANFAHAPGLRVVVPSTPEDAAGLMWTALQADDPTIFLLPKHRLRQHLEVDGDFEPVPFGRAAVRRTGSDVTVVAWGNCIESALEAAERLVGAASVEVIDLRTIVPWDRKTLAQSLEKTGRLVIVQEDVRSCSVGQMLISELVSDPQTWDTFRSCPQLVSRPDVHVGFNPLFESGILPSAERVVVAIQTVLRD